MFKRTHTLLSKLVLAALGFAVSQAALAATEVKISSVVWIGYAPLYIASEQNLFEPYGVEVDLTIHSDNTLMSEDLQNKDADAATLTYDEALRVTANGIADVKVVIPIDYSSGGDAIVARKEITSIADLKGKKVGYNFLAPPDILMSYALHENGMTENDIQPSNLPADEIQSALESAKIDAGATYEPNVSIIKRLGGGNKYHVIFSSKDAPGLITDTLVFRTDFIQQQPDTVKGVIQGYLDGLAYMQKEPDEAAKIVSMVMGIRASGVPEELKTVHIPALEEMPAVFKQSEEITSLFSSGKLIGELLMKKGAIKAVPAIADTFDASFVESLLK